MEEILQTLCACGICHLTVNYPKKLKCQHIFCHECLVTYITEHFGQASFLCPVCNYKHLPDEADAEIDDTVLSALEEDSLTRSLHQFYGEADDDLLATNGHGVECVRCQIHCRMSCTYYCVQCNVVACVLCKRERHSNCDIQLINKSLKSDFYYKIRQLTSDMDSVVFRTQNVHEKITSKLENVVPDRENTVSVVKEYYANLKEKVVKYLDEQKEKVLNKIEDLEKNERRHLQQDASVCQSLFSSVDSRQKLAIALQMHTEMKPSQNMVITGHLTQNVAAYKNMLPQLETDAYKLFDLRFLIDTDLEDRLTVSDLVKIEVIDSCHAGPVAISFDGEKDTGAEASSGQVEGGTDIGSGQGTYRQAVEGDTVPHAGPEEEHPPPSYRGVAEYISTQIRRPFEAPVRRHTVSSDPPQTVTPTTHIPSQSHLQPSAPPLDQNWYSDSAEHVDQQAFDESESLHTRSVEQPQVLDTYPTSASSSSGSTENQGTKTDVEGLTARGTVDVQLSGDYKEPCLTGIASLADAFLFVDRSNHCLKVLNQRGSLLNVYDFGDMEPWDVATVSDMECVVTAPKERQLVFLRDPCLRYGDETTVRLKLNTGQYARIAYHKQTRLLVGCRCPPFSAARIDLLNMNGHVTKKIALASLANPKNFIITDKLDVIYCDQYRREVVFIMADASGSVPPERFTGSAAVSLMKPNGVATVTGLEVVIILDGHNGNIFTTSFQGEHRSLLSYKVSVEDGRNPEHEYQICASADGTTLAVVKTDGMVSLYDMAYSYKRLGSMV